MEVVGYLGPKGTYSELATLQYAKDRDAKLVESDSFFSLYEGVLEDRFSTIIVPFENSVEGAVTISVDLLVEYPSVFINREIIVQIENCLLGLPEVKVNGINWVISHEQPLAQCRNKIRSLYPNASLRAVSSTAAGVHLLKDPHDSGVDPERAAVIGHRNLADKYNLKIVQPSMNDFSNNQTRFLVLSKSPSPQSGDDKTTLLFTIEKEHPGGLVGILTEFSDRGINLTHISSRPSKRVLGEYVFFIDAEGHYLQPSLNAAIENVKERSSYFRLLGSYGKDTIC